MGNKNSGGNGKIAKHGTHLVARTRGVILRAMDVSEKRDRPLSELLADALEDAPIKFLTMAAKYLPKEVNVDVTHTKQATALTDNELADIIAERARLRHDEAKTIEGEVESSIESTG